MEVECNTMWRVGGDKKWDGTEIALFRHLWILRNTLEIFIASNYSKIYNFSRIEKKFGTLTEKWLFCQNTKISQKPLKLN